jgi:transposase
MSQRRKFDKEIKLMTVELSKNRENLVDLAKELDIKVGLIYRWRRELLDKGGGSFPGKGKPKQTP